MQSKEGTLIALVFGEVYVCICRSPSNILLFHLSLDIDEIDLGEMGRREVRLYLQEGPVKIITVRECVVYIVKLSPRPLPALCVLKNQSVCSLLMTVLCFDLPLPLAVY